MTTTPLRMTPALAAAVTDRLGQQGLTYADVLAAGGPSAASMTKIVQGDCEPIAESTCRKLDKGLGWTKGTARSLAAGETPSGPVATRVVDGKVVEVAVDADVRAAMDRLKEWLDVGRQILDDMDRMADTDAVRGQS